MEILNTDANVIVLIVLAIAVAVAIVLIRRSKGKCAYCSHNETCPFRKVNKNV